jgi:4-hydroxyphenylpyruvate dioxygenase
MRNNFLDNPLGTDGFEFVEFTGDNDSSLGRLFESLGFAAVSRYRSKAVLRYKQGNINFLLNMESKGPPAEFRSAHGASINAMAFRVQNAAKALPLALERGAKEIKGSVGPMELEFGRIGLEPCEVMVIPRGVRFGVDLLEASARG